LPIMSGKRAFLDLLKQEGVEVMFGNPGTTELPLMDAFATENELRYLLGLQEAAVMAMADGYAQASGKLAVVNLHVAPGLGNAMGMLYDAQKAGSPILVTAGQHEQTFNATEPILWADLPTIARPLVKWSSEVHRLADLPRLVHRAAKTALAPPWPICRGSCIVPPRPRWRRPRGPYSSRCPGISCGPTRTSISPLLRASRRGCAEIAARSKPPRPCLRMPSVP